MSKVGCFGLLVVVFGVVITGRFPVIGWGAIAGGLVAWRVAEYVQRRRGRLRPDPTPGLYGLCFRWIASDAAGDLALFNTNGEGVVPAALWERRHEQQDLMAHLQDSPGSGEAKKPWGMWGIEDSAELARKGLFVYFGPDLGDIDSSGGYYMTAYPATPRTVADLPAELRPGAEIAVFTTIDFAANRNIEPTKYFECVR